MNHDIFASKPSLKNRLIECLTNDWQPAKQIWETHFKGELSLPYLGHALRSLVRLELADVEDAWEHTRYRRGAGQTIILRGRRKGKKPSSSLVQDQSLSTSKVPVPVPPVIIAGDDYLVFSSIVKIRMHGPRRVTVFYAAMDTEFNLAHDEYEGEAAENIIEAFQQRLYGWNSLKVVDDLKSKITEKEVRITELQNELSEVHKRLERFRKILTS